jgi:hypothetical protein
MYISFKILEKDCKVSAQNYWPKMCESQILCCSCHKKKKKKDTTLLSMSSDKPSNNLTSGKNYHFLALPYSVPYSIFTFCMEIHFCFVLYQKETV